MRRRAEAQHRAMTRVVWAYGLGVVAEWALWVAIIVYAFEQGGSAAAGLTSLGLLVPAALTAPFSGVSGDGPRPNRALVTVYGVETLALAGAGICAGVRAPLVVVVAFASVAVAALGFVRPTLSVVVPGLARSARDLTRTNLRIGMCNSGSVLVGPLIAGAGMTLDGPWLALVACAALAGIGFTLTLPLARMDPPKGEGARARLLDVGSIAGSMRSLTERRGVPTLLIVMGGQFVLIGALDLLYVVLAADVLHLSRSGPGVLAAVVGAGALVSSFASSSLVGRGRLAPLVTVSLAVISISVLALGCSATMLAALVALPAIGFSRSLLDLTSRMLLQRTAAPTAVASVFAAVEMLAGVGMAVGSSLTQILIAVSGVRTALVGLGVFFGALLALTARRLWRADENADVPVVAIQLLRTLPLFASLPPLPLEAVGRAAKEITVRAGTVVVAEGDEGHEFYAIASGQLEVELNGEHICMLERGDSFGEVALLADVPRTATVIARTACELLSIDRASFLLAVTGHGDHQQAARGSIQGLQLNAHDAARLSAREPELDTP